MKNILSAFALVASLSVIAQSGSTDLADAKTGTVEHRATLSADTATSFELVSFVADPSGDAGMTLQWTTASEGPDMRFLVERSPDRMNWLPAFTKDGEGSFGDYTTYDVTDLEPITGISYYRLTAMQGSKEIEASDDFSAEYHPAPALQFRNEREHGRFTVEGKGAISDMRLLNDRGQFMPMEMNYQGDHVLVNAERLVPGTYFVQAVVDGTPVLRPLIVTVTGVIGG